MSDELWSEQNLEQIVEWCEQAYPEEGCGLIVSTEEGEYRVICAENLADKYHEMDPEAYPRTAREFYMIDPREFMRVEERGEQLEVIFHSHADVGDYFSDEDVSAATLPRDDEDAAYEPSYPGVDYLVVSVRDGGADGATLFRFDSDEAARGDDGEPFPPVLEIEIDDGEYRLNSPHN